MQTGAKWRCHDERMGSSDLVGAIEGWWRSKNEGSRSTIVVGTIDGERHNSWKLALNPSTPQTLYSLDIYRTGEPDLSATQSFILRSPPAANQDYLSRTSLGTYHATEAPANSPGQVSHRSALGKGVGHCIPNALTELPDQASSTLR